MFKMLIRNAGVWGPDCDYPDDICTLTYCQLRRKDCTQRGGMLGTI